MVTSNTKKNELLPFFGLLFVAFLIGVLVGCYFCKKNMQKPEYQEHCSCVCCSGLGVLKDEAAEDCRKRVKEDSNEEYYCYDDEDK